MPWLIPLPRRARESSDTSAGWDSFSIRVLDHMTTTKPMSRHLATNYPGLLEVGDPVLGGSTDPTVPTLARPPLRLSRRVIRSFKAVSSASSPTRFEATRHPHETPGITANRSPSSQRSSTHPPRLHPTARPGAASARQHGLEPRFWYATGYTERKEEASGKQRCGRRWPLPVGRCGAEHPKIPTRGGRAMEHGAHNALFAERPSLRILVIRQR